MINNLTFRVDNYRKSFTLIELLVVLALVSILSVVVILTLNPVELIKQARDSNRLSDLSTINTSLNLFSADVTNGFMGTSTVVYVSIPDNASSTCGSLGLPTLPTGYTYNCVTTANLRNANGSGWIPVNFQQISSNSPISQLPIDPINTTTSLNYYTYISGGSWKLSAILEAQKNLSVANLDGGTAPGAFETGNNLTLGQTIFPNGWIKVPGDSRFGTSDFWVMKYEAKCADASGNLLTSPDTGSQSYSDVGTNCTTANSRSITSNAAGFPVASVNHTNSILRCQSIGAHLITNNEWQTISWNVQGVASNWSGGSVGSGYISRGHTDTSPNGALLASSDDTQGYINTGNTSGNQKRTLTLSNGQVIWDLAGNIREYTNDLMTGTNEPYGPGAGQQIREFTDITNWGVLPRQAFGPLDPTWNSTQGIGKMYSWDGTTNTNVYTFQRGGGFIYENTYAGVEMISFINGTVTYASTDGFRCAR